MATIQSKSEFTTFDKVVQHYEQYYNNSGIKIEGKGNFWKIRGFFLDYKKFLPYFGIRNKSNVLIIEFCLENGKDSLLHTAIKHKEHWEEIRIFGKAIKHNSKYPTGGHISIECDYSLNVEKLCAYINEFIYQVNGRMKSVLTLKTQ